MGFSVPTTCKGSVWQYCNYGYDKTKYTSRMDCIEKKTLSDCPNEELLEKELKNVEEVKPKEASIVSKKTLQYLAVAAGGIALYYFVIIYVPLKASK